MKGHKSIILFVVIFIIVAILGCTKLDSNYSKGLQFYKKDSYDSAIVYLQKAYEKEPENAKLNYCLGKAYYAMSNFSYADLHLSIAYYHGIDNADINFKIGKILAIADTYRLHHFRRTIELDSTHQQAWYYAGLCYAKQEDFENAYQFFTKAIELDSTDHLSYHMRARVSYAVDSLEAAIADVDEAISLHDSSYYFYQKAGMLYELKKDQAAIEYADKALLKDSLFVDALYYKALSLNGLGRFSEACNQVRKMKSILEDTQDDTWDLSELDGRCQ